MDQILQLFGYSTKAVGTILLLALAGVLLVRFKAIKDESLSVLSRLVINVSLPCLLFTKIGRNVDLKSLLVCWPLPVSCLLYILVGLTAGFIIAKACRPRQEFFRGTVAATAFANSGFIPIPLIAAITMIFPQFSQNQQLAEAQGIAYISAYLLVYSPVMWIVGYNLISHRKLSEMRWNQLIPPPVIGMALGIIVGTVPGLKDTFCLRTGHMSPIFEAAALLGQATIPCAMIVLGGKLAYGPCPHAVNKRTIICVALVKLLFLPSFAIIYVIFLRRYGIIPNDALFAIVLIIEAAMPQATNLVIMSSVVNPNLEKGMATILFWNYLVSIPSITIFLAIAVWLFA